MSKYYTRPSNLELCHHGIKGMKWGGTEISKERRYPDECW